MSAPDCLVVILGRFNYFFTLPSALNQALKFDLVTAKRAILRELKSSFYT